MGSGLGRLAGAAAFGIMLLRLGELLESGPEAPDWQLIMIASAFLGGVIWWLLGQTLTSRRLAMTLFVVAGVLLFLRIAVPDILALGFLPTFASIGALGDELGQTLNLIRFGVAPLPDPTSGLVAILALLMWGTGALYVWGASGGPTLAMIAPSLGLYLQFAVMDRIQAGLPWMIALAIVTALSLAALGVERSSEAGRARDAEGRPLARRAGSMALIVATVLAGSALYVTDVASPLVPSTGNIRWRYGGGYGPGFGGTTFDRLADLQQSFIRRSNAVMFVATLDPDAPPANEIYWRMESLDDFDGEAWHPTTSRADFYQPGLAGGNPEHAYRGTSQEVTQRVQIVDLRSAVVPTVGIGQLFRSDDVDVSGFQITADGSAIYQPELGEGDEYEALSLLPLSQEDLGALATLPDGTLSPLFANAADAGEVSLEPGPPPGAVRPPSDIDRFTELPDLPPGLTQIARRQTAGASTPFEAAWLLQHWFRDSEDFEYSTEVSTGYGALDLAAWLDDEESQNFRTGYCVQFAVAMAVLGRTVGIPSRVVWGFTPGSVEESNGTELIVVRDKNAHLWVEMWMDGFGWVRFDPTPRGDGALPESITAGFDPNEYLPESDNPLTLEQPGFFESQFEEGLTDFAAPTDGTGAGFRLSWAWLAIPVLALLVGLVPMLKALRRRRRIKRLHQGDITAAWDEIVDRLADLRTPVPAFQTPLEFARATGKDLVPLASSYSATVYGHRTGQGHVSDLTHAETWIERNYETWDRALAAFNPRSLIDKD